MENFILLNEALLELWHISQGKTNVQLVILVEIVTTMLLYMSFSVTLGLVMLIF